MRYAILIFLFFIDALKMNAQAFPDLQFENVTANTELSNKVVGGVVEDKNGFIWITSPSGIIRYDGYRYKHFYHEENNKNSLINNTVIGFLCDSKNRLWITTTDGLSCYIINENKFINYSSRFEEPMQIAVNNNISIYEDPEKTIWICSQKEFIFKVKADYTLEKVKLLNTEYKLNSGEIGGYSYMYKDNEGKEWAISISRIYLLDGKTKQIKKTYNFDDNFVQGGAIVYLMQDSKGKYWVGTWASGVMQFLPNENKLVKIKDYDNSVSYQLKEWNYKNHKWLVTATNFGEKSGLTLINTDNSTFKRYGEKTDIPLSLKSKWFHNIFIDSKNNLWLATSEGLNKVSAVQKAFDIKPITEPGTNNFDDKNPNEVYAYFENKNSNWTGIRGYSTTEYDSNFNIKNYYNSLYPLTNKNRKGYMNSHYFYQNGDDIFMTTDSGLVCYNNLNKTSELYFPNAYSKNADLRTIVPFSKNEILIRSYKSGLFVFDTEQKKFTKWFTNRDTSKNSLPLIINYLFKTSTNDIYVSTMDKGLMHYNYQQNNFDVIIPANKIDFNKNIFYAIDEAKDGNLWICTNDGVYEYDTENNLIKAHYTANGLLSLCYRICIDNYQNVWVNTSNAYWCYVKEKNKWISYDEKDGLTTRGDDGIMAKRSNGDIVVGLKAAIAIFHPNMITENKYKSIITEAIIGNKIVELPMNDGATKKIIIPVGENSFTIDFTILNYETPKTSKYFYKLSPLMKDFKENADGHLNFNGLAPGTYTLIVKGADKTGELFDLKDELTIVVEPHWYQTNLFKILATLLIGFLIYLFFKRRIATVRKEAALKQKITETEIAALKAQMNPHFIFNSINSIDALIQSNDKYNATNYLNKFAKLIRNVLDSSKENTVTFNKDVETLNLYMELEKLRSENKFTTTIHVSPELMNSDYKVPPLIVQPFVENAIHHGLRKRKDNNGVLTINIERVEDKIIYHIEDNGIGRVAAAKTTKSEHSSYGMQMSNDRIKMFNEEENASINIDDLYNGEQAVGTKVTVQLKIK